VSRKAWVIVLIVATGIAVVYVWGALAQLGAVR
jgi:hypothetical protein